MPKSFATYSPITPFRVDAPVHPVTSFSTGPFPSDCNGNFTFSDTISGRLLTVNVISVSSRKT